ncbi:MAG: class I SAM-dependent methyltransferase [Candidatus Omnitrophota bacterium]
MDRTSLSSNFLSKFLACPACKGNMTISKEVIECAGCGRRFKQPGSIYINLFPEDVVEKNDYRNWRERQDFFIKWVNKMWNRSLAAASSLIYDEFMEYVGDKIGGFTLDIGCSDGHLRKRLVDTLYIGIDPYEGWIINERPEFMDELFPISNTGIAFIKGLGEYLPFSTGSFDNVFITNTLDHSNEPYKMLSEASRVLKPGGSLYIMHENPSLINKVRNSGIRENFIKVIRRLKGLFLVRYAGSIHKHIARQELEAWLDTGFNREGKDSINSFHIFYHCVKKIKNAT